MKLNSITRALFWRAINSAIPAKLIPSISRDRALFLARSRRALKRNLAEPGDCAGDPALLVGLALAEAEIGRSAGWIPEVQRIGVAIANLLK